MFSFQVKSPFQRFVKILEDGGFTVSFTKSLKTVGLPPKKMVFLTSLIVKRVFSVMVVILHSREVS